jgi:PAS domain S-box-containing protein
VETEADFLAALRPPRQPDLILADFNLPSMDGLRALELKQVHCPATPFIFVSGALGEDIAIDALKHGATDFVLKDAIARLPSAVTRALGEAAQSRAKTAAEERLRMLSQAVDQGPVAVFITDLDGRIVFVNPRLCALTGCAEAELLGGDPKAFLAENVEPGAFSAARARLDHHGSWHGELEFRSASGPPVPVRLTMSVMRDPAGTVCNHLVLAEDITQWRNDQERQRRLEAQLFQVQKLESIGTLAGGIAHDFNNILTGILGFTDLATHALPPDSAIRDDLREIRSAGLRAKDLVAQILTFSRQGDTRLTPLNLARPVGEALKLVRDSIPASIELTRSLQSGIVQADPTQIHQIVLNLCTNAVHAMGADKGRLDVSVQQLHVDGARAAEIPHLQPGDWMLLAVSDTGHGMDEPTLRRIFDPFFTTKQPGEGTGLGLAIVQGIVANHHGALHVRSQPGRGTTFEIYLPVALGSEEMPVSTEPVPRGHGEEILVVDDEPTVAIYAGACLNQLNYRATVFHDPLEAVAACRAQPRRFAAIVTDLTMPRVTGVDLLHQVRAFGRDVPAIIMSGYHTDLARTKITSLPGAHIITKPFASDDLARLLHRVLHPAPGAGGT